MPVARFAIVARAHPQTLVRLLNAFAQLGLQPSRVEATEAQSMLTIRIDQPDLPERQARIVAEKMRSAVLVDTVHLRIGQRDLLPCGEHC